MFCKMRSAQPLARLATWIALTVVGLAPPSFAVADGITPEILAAAKTEGQVTWYTSADLVLANKLKAAFEQKYVDMKVKKMLQPFAPATANLIRSAKLSDPEHYWHAVKLELTSLNYNNDKLKGADVPKTWKDLLDPKYNGKIVQGHIKSSGDTALIAYNLVKMYGWEYFEGLRKNNVLTMQACTQVELVARGERLIMMCDYSQL